MPAPVPGPAPLRATVILDYQNVHLTAHDIFDPRGPRHHSIIEPTLFARRAVAERNARQREGYPHARCARVLVYRGLPHADYDTAQNAICLAQATDWRAQGALVELRDLKYDVERGADGQPILDVHGKKVPKGRGREKGIDVLCALAGVRESTRPETNLVILASRDTDLVPALDEVYDMACSDPKTYAKIQTATWYQKGARNFGSLRPTGARRIWNTNLDETCYDASIDRTDYRTR